jgi:hypothetical protein
MKTLKFSKENNDKLKNIKEWSPIENPRVYSFSLLSGFSCPKALDCQTYAIKDKATGKRTVLDGKHAEFRCFSAIQEAQYPSVYNQRKHNFDTLLEHKDNYIDMTELILNSLPVNADYIRVHVGGDFFNKNYMLAWYLVAKLNPNIKFYAYTKSIKWMSDLEHHRPNNFSMIASYGSKEDALIDELNLKSANVVFHPSETTKPIDKNEYYAINDKGSFSLLLHGTQKQGSKGSKAIKRMNKENIKYSYSRK